MMQLKCAHVDLLQQLVGLFQTENLLVFFLQVARQLLVVLLHLQLKVQ